jgi:hypothetical protein
MLNHPGSAVLYCHLWTVWFYLIFSHYLIKGAIFRKKKLPNIKCVFWFSLQRWYETFLILWRIQRDIIINVHRSSCKEHLFLSVFNKTWIFKTDFRKILKYRISWNSVQWVELFHVDKRTDMRKLTVAFRNFAKAPKNKDNPQAQYTCRVRNHQTDIYWVNKETNRFS